MQNPVKGLEDKKNRWSVSRVLYSQRSDDHSSRIAVTRNLQQPTRTPCGSHETRSYLVLLQVRFTLPWLLPTMRCALTAPFQPYLVNKAVFFLWHFLWGRPRRALPATFFHKARTFLVQARGHPTIWFLKLLRLFKQRCKNLCTLIIPLATQIARTKMTLKSNDGFFFMF